ncbi:RNA polymerase sigma factor [Pseudochryseolinea flava]|uniref:RNA polymerase subunit sigma-24 n=1 Tax=Pseudochryseolinea flava TaxID=2059302 RepID=A0A364Y9U5_9BACT|nr:sigma-70 family RNA polymerase sigma factor [Pseudochryseolinea flava]RAW02972.1 RNA polymerase subunit sigma-24 [Pseudochryseolinea flava]
MSSDRLDIKTDSALLQQYKAGRDLAVLGVLYNRYMSMVYGVCLKYLKDRDESKDATMQLFEKLATSLHQHEVANFRAWVYVMAKNHCLMQLRARKGKNFEEISPLLMENDATEHPGEEPELESNLSKLEDCMGTLVAEQKQCVQLFYLEQKCYREISALTGYDDNKVKSYIQNGKRNLKICMEKNA